MDGNLPGQCGVTGDGLGDRAQAPDGRPALRRRNARAPGAQQGGRGSRRGGGAKLTYQWRREKFMTKRPSSVPDGWKLTKFFRKNERRQFLLSCQGFQKRRWPFLVHEMKGGWWISFLQKKIAPPDDLVKRLAPDPHRDTRLSDMIREGRLEDLGKGSWRYRAFTSDEKGLYRGAL